MRARPAWALGAALLAAALAPGAIAAPLTPAERELAAAQRELDAASADLARFRTVAEAAPPDAAARLARRERALATRKARLYRRVEALAVRSLERARTEGDVWVILDEDEAADAAPAAGPADAATYTEALSDGVRLRSTPGTAAAALDEADAIDAYLAARTSPLAGLGATFVQEARAVGLDPRFLVAIAGAETSFGTYAPSQAIHNPFGLGPGRTYPSWADAIRFAAQNLAGPLYLGDGRVTIPAIHERWAPIAASNDPTGLNGNWSRNVGTYYAELGGDPAGSVFADTAVPRAAPAPAAALPVGGPGARLATAAVGHLGTAVREEDGSGSGLSPRDLVIAAAEEAGVDVEGDPALAGRPIEPDERRAGDVLVIARPGRERPHVGVYLGAGAFVHASPERGEVSLATLAEARFAGGLLGARRLTPGGP